MDESIGQLTADVFDRVAKKCRWGTRSLAAVRALLVDGEGITAVAAREQMSPQQAGVLRTRFLAKVSLAEVKKVSATDFMMTERPEAEAELEPLKSELLKLHRKKYSAHQMLQYLERNGIQTSEQTLISFLKKVQSNAKTRIRK